MPLALLQDLVRESPGSHGTWALSPWVEAAVRYGPAVLVLVLAFLLIRAAVEHRRFRIRDVLGEAAQEAVRAEVVAAERRTVGEIVPVVLGRSDRHPDAHWLSALVALVVGTLLLADVLPWEHPALVILSQLGLGALGWLASRSMPAWQRLFITEERASAAAEEQALAEFHRLGLRETAARTGVLILVSLLEKRVVVLGDEGIDGVVGQAHWSSANEAILAGIRSGSLRDGMIEGIRRCGAVLAEHFPAREGDRNEVPDRMIVRAE